MSLHTQVIVGAVVGVLVAGCVLVCGWRRVVFARRHHRTLWGGKVVPPLSGAEATLMLAVCATHTQTHTHTHTHTHTSAYAYARTSRVASPRS